jgi:hypothetical protein
MRGERVVVDCFDVLPRDCAPLTHQRRETHVEHEATLAVTLENGEDPSDHFSSRSGPLKRVRCASAGRARRAARQR